MSKKILVSSCLAGIPCRYDGKDCKKKPFERNNPQYILACPEELGGLPTPRAPAEIQNDGRVKTREGVDVTTEYDEGAKLALKIALEAGVTQAYLKSKSPMCGAQGIYDGSFTGKLIQKDGVFANLLKENGIEVISID